jgi:hypothetical protein
MQFDQENNHAGYHAKIADLQIIFLHLPFAIGIQLHQQNIIPDTHKESIELEILMIMLPQPQQKMFHTYWRPLFNLRFA